MDTLLMLVTNAEQAVMIDSERYRGPQLFDRAVLDVLT
jgi:hypothetical protein